MRIATIGKGGAGKSTISAALVKHAAQSQPHVLAIDADINRHLSMLLHIPRATADLGSKYKDILEFLEGHRFDIASFERVPEIGSIPPTASSKKIHISVNDPFLKQFASSSGNISLLTAGTYEDQDVGTTCIHVKLKGIELLLHRLKDNPNEVVIIDVTAGTDPLSTTLALGYDLHLVVVEPTRKSLRVFEDYFGGAREVDGQIFVIANKISSSSDLEFVKSIVPADRMLGQVRESDALAHFNQGQEEAFDEFVKENGECWDAVLRMGTKMTESREKRLKKVVETFHRSCKSWFNDYYDMPLDYILGSENAQITSLEIINAT